MVCVYLQPKKRDGGINQSRYFPVPPASDSNAGSIESQAIQLSCTWGQLGLSPLSPPLKILLTQASRCPLLWSATSHSPKLYSQCRVAQTMYFLPLWLQNDSVVGIWQAKGKGQLHPLSFGCYFCQVSWMCLWSAVHCAAAVKPEVALVRGRPRPVMDFFCTT